MRRLTVLISFLLLTYASISQTNSAGDTGTTCLPNYQLREAIKANEEKKIVKQELAATQQRVSLLTDQVRIKDSLIRFDSVKIVALYSLVDNYKKTVSNLEGQYRLMEEAVARLQKDNKKLKRRLFFQKVGFAIILGATVYVLTK